MGGDELNQILQRTCCDASGSVVVAVQQPSFCQMVKKIKHASHHADHCREVSREGAPSDESQNECGKDVDGVDQGRRNCPFIQPLIVFQGAIVVIPEAMIPRQIRILLHHSPQVLEERVSRVQQLEGRSLSEDPHSGEPPNELVWMMDEVLEDLNGDVTQIYPSHLNRDNFPTATDCLSHYR